MSVKKYCVYKHVVPNGKVYIGMTGQSPKQRFHNGYGYCHNQFFYRAIKKYGWENIAHEIVKDNLTESEAIESEKNLISVLDSTNPAVGYNLMTGGGTIGTHSAATRKKLSKINTGKKRSIESRQKQSKSLMGHSLPEESKERLSKQRLGSGNPFYGKRHSAESKKRIKENAVAYRGEDSVNARAVIQIDLKGNVIREYGAISTAAAENNIPSPYNISACCRGRQKTAYGYMWAYAD